MQTGSRAKIVYVSGHSVNPTGSSDEWTFLKSQPKEYKNPKQDFAAKLEDRDRQRQRGFLKRDYTITSHHEDRKGFSFSTVTQSLKLHFVIDSLKDREGEINWRQRNKNRNTNRNTNKRLQTGIRVGMTKVR